jgi:dihydrofolate synthase / folylpolyglutamate synthase
MKYEDALAYLESLIRFGIKLDLDRFRMLCERVGSPQNRFKSIHIGGTNGKGSTTTMAASILRAAGYKVGTYLSPYVHDVRERVQVNGKMIPQGDFASIMESIIPDLGAVAATEAGQPTEFEAKTLMAFLYFAQQNVDFACIEVGMGGRFDATNVLDPIVSVITNVSLDHMDRLGDTVEKIAFEKAGIVKPGRPVVTAAGDDAWRVIYNAAIERKAPIVCVRPAGDKPCDERAQAVTWKSDEQGFLTVDTPKRVHERLRLGLPGAFQCANAACAVAAVEFVQESGFPVSEEAFRRGLAEARIAGRLETLRRKPTLVIDGAHNPDAAKQLAEAIRTEFQYRRLILVVGMLSTHSAEDFLAQVGPLADHIIATAPAWPLARSVEELAREAARFCPKVTEAMPVHAAVDAALAEAGENDLVLVTGSFYTIGEVVAVNGEQ